MPFKCYAMMQHYQGRIHQNCPDHILSVNFSSLCPERGSAYFMGLELHPCFALQDGAWHILVAPMLMLTAAMNRHLCLQRFSLFICGRCSWVLSLLDCRFVSLPVRRAIIIFPLKAIPEESAPRPSAKAADGRMLRAADQSTWRPSDGPQL